ncbi:MAG TPA: hypothetical protein VHF67_03970 [Gaiellaceae bacterium]|nr:hypothetical protein [Gaiellaceae bacterium]
MPNGRSLVVPLALVFVVAAIVPASTDAARRPPRPSAGAVVVSPPVLRWPAVRGASYYNVQVYRDERKILSRWPRQARLPLRRVWQYRGRWYDLRPGAYRWFVWPYVGRRFGRGRVRSSFVVGRGPANTANPRILGSAREGSILTAVPGTWTGSPRPRLSYEWRRCDVTGAACIIIPGATSSTYHVVADDLDLTLQVVVTASNRVRSVAAASPATPPVVPASPAVVAAPTIVGRPQEGQILVAVNGSWTSSRPIAYSFRWQRCRLGEATCVDIPGATGQAYALQPADVERHVRVAVTAANAGGAPTAVSGLSSVIGRVLNGTARAENHRGTLGADVIRARAGADFVAGRAGDDELVGGPGRDRLHGGAGNDLVVARDGEADVVACGPGTDQATVDRSDHVDRSCELVAR